MSQKILVLSQLGYLTLNCVENHPKKSHLLKKLAFTEVFNLGRNNQVTLLLQYVHIEKNFYLSEFDISDRKGERIRRKQTEQLVFYMTHFCCSTCFPRVVRTKTHPKAAELKRAKNLLLTWMVAEILVMQKEASFSLKENRYCKTMQFHEWQVKSSRKAENIFAEQSFFYCCSIWLPNIYWEKAFP